MTLSTTHTNDLQIRTALHRKKFAAFHACRDTIVIDELGVDHGQRRVDVAVLNGHMHAYEIKSDRDNLDRLPSQIEAFSRVFQHVSVVFAERHEHGILKIAPQWCGLISASVGPRGAVKFKSKRKPTKSPNLDFVSVAHLLWKSEVLELLSNKGYSSSDLRKKRIELYNLLSNELTISELTKIVKNRLGARQGWRDL